MCSIRTLITDLPLEFHGPIDFPCFGCALRSIAAYHGIRLSKNSLMFQGAMRFTYPYISGRGFTTVVPEWAHHGFRLDTQYPARAMGIELEVLDHRPERPWSEIWSEWKSYVAAGEPVYFCTRNAEILWDAIGYSEPPLHDGDDRRNIGHCVVLIGFDDEREIGIIHDSHFYYAQNGGVDLPLYEIPVEAIERACSERRVAPPFVFKGRTDARPSLAETLSLQAAIIGGTQYDASFAPPDLPGVATGFRALAAAADDVEAAPDPETLKQLLVGFDRFLRTRWWLGVDGQPARAAWLSGVSAATHNEDVEVAAYYLDASAISLARAADAYVPVRQELRDRAPRADVIAEQRHVLVCMLREAAEHERNAAERLACATRTFSTMREHP